MLRISAQPAFGILLRHNFVRMAQRSALLRHRGTRRRTKIISLRLKFDHQLIIFLTTSKLTLILIGRGNVKFIYFSVRPLAAIAAPGRLPSEGLL